MARANAAYYASREPYADFTTAPEITQVFGEILGIWAAVMWESMGRPDPVVLAEAGPGRGTLMADALRAITQLAPGFRRALHVHLVEASPRLREIQARILPVEAWHEAIDHLPDAPLLLLANEFLDSLPVRQFVRRKAGWIERYVQNGQFVDVSCPAPSREIGDRAGNVLEVCEPARALVETLARRFSRRKGAALFLDYGPETDLAGDSVQALRDGRPADPLAEPGCADLTAHVAFAALADAARKNGAAVFGPMPQGIFLARLGLFQRTDRLAYGKPAGQAMALIEAARRLAEPDAMGRLFKAFAVATPGLPEPPGFSP